jgi:biotin synthase-like enzyme
MQPLALYPANSLFSEGYLTTAGQGAKADEAMIREAGFEIENPCAEKSETIMQTQEADHE